VDADDVRELRRWVWAQLSVRATHRPVPAAAQRWGGDPLLACNDLAAVLLELCRDGAVTAEDARAWAADAALTGQRIRKESIAKELGLTIRGLGGRLARVDDALAGALNARMPPSPAGHPDEVEQTAAALTAAAVAVVEQRWELADAYQILARETAGLPMIDVSILRGKNRSKRSRALRSARAALPRSASMRPVLPRLQRPGGATPIDTISSSLHPEPGRALAELERAWHDGAANAYPLLIDHAIKLIPNVRSANPLSRLRLLEIVVNILRDTESLLAIPAATMWLRESLQVVGPYDRRIIAALRSRAHVMQLHGYLAIAARSLDEAIHRFRAIRYTSEADRRSEWIGLLTRRASVEVARGAAGDIGILTERLQQLSVLPEAANNPMMPRLQLHLQAAKIEAEGWHGSPSRPLREGYDKAQENVIRAIGSAQGAQPLAMVDTLLAAALRVGEGPKFLTWLMSDVLHPLGADIAWGNQFDRMRQRLRQTNGRVPHPDDVALPMVESSLRVFGTVPTVAAYRV
jgi:hypothetical protein